jgi:hypothetical protein
MKYLLAFLLCFIITTQSVATHQETNRSDIYTRDSYTTTLSISTDEIVHQSDEETVYFCYWVDVILDIDRNFYGEVVSIYIGRRIQDSLLDYYLTYFGIDLQAEFIYPDQLRKNNFVGTFKVNKENIDQAQFLVDDFLISYKIFLNKRDIPIIDLKRKVFKDVKEEITYSSDKAYCLKTMLGGELIRDLRREMQYDRE